MEKIRQFRATSLYKTWSRRALWIAPLLAIGVFLLGIVDFGFMTQRFQRFLPEIIMTSIGAAIGVYVVIIAATFFAWLFMQMDLGFQRLGYIVIPAAFVIAYWNHAWEFGRAWRQLRHVMTFIIDGLLPIIGTTAAIIALYIVGVHVGKWVLEGFRKET